MAKNKFSGFGGRGGFGGGANMNGLLQQIQKVQADMVKSQEEIKQLVVEASSGGGMVKVKLNGEHRLVSLEINKEVVDPEEVEMLQDLILSAVNEAQRILEDESNKKMPTIPQMPGMGGLF